MLDITTQNEIEGQEPLDPKFREEMPTLYRLCESRTHETAMFHGVRQHAHSHC